MGNAYNQFMDIVDRNNARFNVPTSQTPLLPNHDFVQNLQKGFSQGNQPYLIDAYQGGDQDALMQLAQDNPELAKILMMQEQQNYGREQKAEKQKQASSQQQTVAMLADAFQQGDMEAGGLLAAYAPDVYKEIAAQQNNVMTNQSRGQITPYQQEKLGLDRQRLGFDISKSQQEMMQPQISISDGKVIRYNKQTRQVEVTDTSALSPEQQQDSQSLLNLANQGNMAAAADLNVKYPDVYKAFDDNRRQGNYDKRTQAISYGGKAQQARTIGDLRKEFKQNADPYISTLDQIARLESVLKNAEGGVADRASIQIIQKAIDPDSAVLPSEFKTVAEASGLWEQVKNYPNALATGRLPPELISQIKQMAQNLKQTAQQKLQAYKQEADYLAESVDSPKRDVTGIAKNYLPVDRKSNIMNLWGE